MRYFFVCLLACTIGVVTEAKAQKSAPKKIEFTYPDDIADSSKKTFVKEFNQGNTLYGIMCSSCHNKTVDNKTLIPDFSLPQLMDYEMRMYTEHGEDLGDNKVTDVEMQKIILFLRYKKKSGVTVRPPAKL